MAQGQGRGASGRYTWIWMVVAFLMVGGFMGWLAMTAEPSAVAVVEEAEEEPAAGVVTITTNDLMTNASGLKGQSVSLAEARVVGRLGTQAFWIELPNQSPYLIKLAPELVAGGFAVQSGQVVSVTGRIVTMTDSVLTAWQQEGVITDEGQKAEAEYVLNQTFLEAREARQAGSDAAAGSGAAQQE